MSTGFLHSSRQNVGRVGAYLPPSKLSLTMGISIPISNSGSLGPPDSASKTASQPVQPFCAAHGPRQKLAIQRETLSPKIAPFHGDLNLHLTNGSLGPPKLSTQTASRSVQPFLQAHYGNRRTHRQTTVTGPINVYVCTAMQPNNNKWSK